MKGQHIALCFLLLASLAPALSAFRRMPTTLIPIQHSSPNQVGAEPACPQLRCAPPNTNVACFVGTRRCQCRCVGDREPCTSLLHQSCPQGRTLSCNRNSYECRCRCVRK